MVPLLVHYLSLKPETPKRDYWDYGLIYDLLSQFEFTEVDTLYETNLAIVVLPARHHAGMEKEVNKELNKIKKVVFFAMGDEEGEFKIEKIKHPDISIWVQNPKPKRHDEYRKLGTGYPPQIKECKELPEKTLDWYFSGQITHSRREECAEQLREISNGVLIETKGFTQGVPHEEYYKCMSEAKIAPCPSGPITVDSFRLFEALELGCIPIADTQTSNEDWAGFWEWLFEEPVLFIEIKDWTSLPGYIKDLKKQYPMMNNRVQAFWMRYKRKLHKKLMNDLDIEEELTIVIPVSPIKSHPETHILEETIKSAVFHHPNSEIIITFDGVREEQEDMRADYEEHIRRILWKCREWNVKPYIFENHKHQSGMMQEIIDEIHTPMLLYMEQDTPLVTDCEIQWDKIYNLIMAGESNMVRLHHEALIHPEHKHMMLSEPIDEFVKTAQWSQRPHVASTAFYRRMMSENFSEKTKCFIEDLLHGKLHQAYVIDGEQGWNQWRVHIYHPDGGNIKRSGNLDGRDGEEKFDTNQVW